jgi:exopolysaccharide biosynthesis protein
MLVLLAGLCFGCSAGQPLIVSAVTRETPDGIARGRLAVVDLTLPEVQVRVVAGPRRTTESIVREGMADLAINANYFGGDGIVGLVIVDGREVSGPRGDDPVLLIYDTGLAEVTTQDRVGLHVVQAVAGVGVSETAAFGSLLIEDGENLGKTTRVEPSKRHPRSAVGVCEDGRTLYLVVIDGRQPGHSVGVTLPELAAILLEAGASDAINLDGGGSASMVWRDGDTLFATKQSGVIRRPAPVHLGIRVKSGREE